jgi:RNase P protein component
MKTWCTAGRVLIIHARSGAVSLPFRELESELTELLRQSFASGIM